MYILLFIVIFILLLYIYSGKTIAPWLPARKLDLDRINTLAKLKEGDVFYELGCGDGRVCQYIAQKNPNCLVVGVEIFLPVFLLAKFWQIFSFQKNLKIKYKNALNIDLKNVDVIYTFALTDTINGGFGKKIKDEMKKSARLISYVFQIDDWDGKEFISKPDKDSFSIFVYKL